MPDLRIGEIAAAAAVSVDTIRYYERRGLIPRARRTPGGYRAFRPDTVQRVRLIRQAQEIGLSLDEIKELLGGSGGAEKCRRVSALLRSKLKEIEGRIRTMKSFRRALADHLTACERELNDKGEAAVCPVMVKIGSEPRAPEMPASEWTR